MMISHGFAKKDAAEWALDPALTVDSLARYVEWACGGDAGVSSKTLLGAIIGVHLERYPCIPHDPADFGRCYRMLKLFPEIRARLGEVVARRPEWARLVERWPELERMYEQAVNIRAKNASELYAAIKECTR